MARLLVGAAAWLVLAAAVAALTGSLFLPGLAGRYYLLLPGDAFPVDEAIRVPDGRRQEVGSISYAIVYQAEDDLFGAVRRANQPGVRVVPYEAIIPPGTSVEQSNELARRMMSESQTAAAVVALRRAGHPIQVGGEGVRVVQVIAGRPAEGRLERDDLVLAVDDEPVGTAVELIDAVRRRSVGDELALTIQRRGETAIVRVGTAPAPGEPSRPAVGIMIETVGFRADLPFPVEIDAGAVVGPSAGLMFALGIYDALTPGRLGGGEPVAGTGTLALDGRVGAIDGVVQKVIGAERRGARLFLAPRENAAAARAAAGTIRVVPVDTFDDALAALGAS